MQQDTDIVWLMSRWKVLIGIMCFTELDNFWNLSEIHLFHNNRVGEVVEKVWVEKATSPATTMGRYIFSARESRVLYALGKI